MTLGLVHTPKIGTTQVDLQFNSLCKLDDGILLAANELGIHTLDTSGTDDGSPIDAWAEFPRTDFDLANQKRLRKLKCSFEADGMQKISFRFDEDIWMESYLEPDIDTQKSEGMNVPGARAVSGRHFGCKWENVYGSDFSLDAIDVMLTLRHKRAGRSKFFRDYGVMITQPLGIIAGEYTPAVFTTWDDDFGFAYPNFTISDFSIRMEGNVESFLALYTAPVGGIGGADDLRIRNGFRVDVLEQGLSVGVGLIDMWPGASNDNLLVSMYFDGTNIVLVAEEYDETGDTTQMVETTVDFDTDYVIVAERVSGVWAFTLEVDDSEVWSSGFTSNIPTFLYEYFYISAVMELGYQADVTVGPLYHRFVEA